MTTFSESRRRFPASHQVLLDDLLRILDHLTAATEEPTQFRQQDNPVSFFNSYVDFAVAVYAEKLSQLYNGVAHALERQAYLVYAAAGRAILENAATLHYYARHQDLANLRTAWSSLSMNDELLKRATGTLDRFVRGSRFTWDAFVEGRFEALSERPADDSISQVNVKTCLQKWWAEKPNVRHLYDLFCDLVHPNLGSNLLVLRSSEGHLVAGGQSDTHVSQFVVAPTLAGIVGAYRSIQDDFLELEAVRLPGGA